MSKPLSASVTQISDEVSKIRFSIWQAYKSTDQTENFHEPHMPFLNSVKNSSDVSKLHHLLPLINKTGENRQKQAPVQIPAHYQHCPKLDLSTQETAGQCSGSISRSTQGSQASVAPVTSRGHKPSVLTGSVSTWALNITAVPHPSLFAASWFPFYLAGCGSVYSEKH